MPRPPTLLYTQPKNTKVIYCLIIFFIIFVGIFSFPINISIPLSIFNIIILTILLVKSKRKHELCFSLTDHHIQFHREQKGWCIRWEDISAIDVITVSKDNWYQKLPWIGIQLINYDSYLDSINISLAIKILNEQQSLLILGYRYKNTDIRFENILFDDHPFITKSGRKYTGILAILGNRMKYMKILFGFDVFIEEEFCFESTDNLVGELRQHLAYAAYFRETHFNKPKVTNR